MHTSFILMNRSSARRCDDEYSINDSFYRMIRTVQFSHCSINHCNKKITIQTTLAANHLLVVEGYKSYGIHPQQTTIYPSSESVSLEVTIVKHK